MEDDLVFRKQAAEMYLKGDSISDIGRKLGRSRQWVYKWILRYRTKGGDAWYLSESTSPKHVNNRVVQQEEELVVNVRKALEGRAYSQTGALTIMYEIERMD